MCIFIPFSKCRFQSRITYLSNNLYEIDHIFTRELYGYLNTCIPRYPLTRICGYYTGYLDTRVPGVQISGYQYLICFYGIFAFLLVRMLVNITNSVSKHHPLSKNRFSHCFTTNYAIMIIVYQ
jgi:hypothetical protein